MTSNASLANWVNEAARLTRPERIHWCDGTEAEYESLLQLMLSTGDLLTLNQETHPGCYLHRSYPRDVARVEHLTYICTPDESDAGPNNNWMAPNEGHTRIDGLFDGAMEGRVMYVIPLLHGTCRFTLLALRGRDYRQPLCRCQHETHDPHGGRCVGEDRARRHFRKGPAFHR